MFSCINRLARALVATGLLVLRFGLQLSVDGVAASEDWWGASTERPVNFAVHLVRDMKHVGAPFTEGLEFAQNGEQLIETSGSFPPGTPSFVRALDARTGKVLEKTSDGLLHGAAGRGRFVEGITQLETSPGEVHWFTSTYTDNVVVEYDQDFAQVAEHHFPFQGWGLTHNADGTAFFATNGSAKIMELAPPGKEFKPPFQGSFEVLSAKTATCGGRPVPEINELEMVQNFTGRGRPALLGNVLSTRVVIVLDPASMRCIGAFDLEGLGAVTPGEREGEKVANGIAYNRHTGHFVVTGKNWDKMFEIRVTEEPSGGGGGRALQLLAQHLSSAAGTEAEQGSAEPHVGRPARRHGLRASTR